MSNFPDGTDHAAISRWADAVEDEAAPVLVYRPLPEGWRADLLLILGPGHANAADHEIAFAVQSLLDDYATPYDPADFKTTMRGAEAKFGRE